MNNVIGFPGPVCVADAEPGLYECNSPQVLPNTCVVVKPVEYIRTQEGYVETFGTYRDAATGRTCQITNPEFLVGSRVHQV